MKINELRRIVAPCGRLVVFTLLFALACLSTLNSKLSASPLGTAFTYQGRLNDDGIPAQGIYDLRLAIYDAASDGTLVAGPITNSPVAVSNGLFTTTLDFGADAFAGGARWLEISARTNGSTRDFSTLSPRQPLTPAPYALHSASAGTATQVAAANISGRLADSQVSTNVAMLNTSPNFAGTVTASSFIGRGALPWQEVTGPSQSAVPNTAYLANNATQVVVTLPAAPAVGDIVRVSGLGAGGWRIAQNNGQFILTENIGGIGTVWTPHESNRWWSCVASSTDGTRLAATVNDSMEGRIHLSADSGASWIARGPTQAWQSVACSADGTKLVAVPWYGQLHTSDDYGTNWTARDIVREWRCVASSADGTKLVAVPNASFILTSTNSGATWTTIETNAWWNRVAMSADGNIIYAAGSGPVYMSFDFGVTWYAQGDWNSWSDIACSADGSKVFATAMYLYTSTNYGFGWNAHGNNGSYRAIACSANGARAVTVDGTGRIYTSADSGLTWTERLNGMYNWWTVASSADGAKLVATGNGMPIYTSVPTTTPGDAGYLAGVQDSEVQLQYVGNNQFRILNSEGTINLQGAMLPTGLAVAQAGLQSLQVGLNTKVSIAGDTMTGPLFNYVTIAGNGGGLTNLNADNLTGTVPDARLALNVARTNQVWLLNGNVDATAGPQFLGTIDNQPLEFKVNNLRALRLEPNSTSPNVIGGYSGNLVDNSAGGATISGGGSASAVNRIRANLATIGGGWQNVASGYGAFIGGGGANIVSNSVATVAGGYGNIAGGMNSTVAGGNQNIASGSGAFVGGGGFDNGGNKGNLASGVAATIGGGCLNAASGLYGTLGGGLQNVVSGTNATVGGGSGNTASSANATIGGGWQNVASGYGAFIGGGGANIVSNSVATVAGGYGNIAGGMNSTVAGGYSNAAIANCSFAAGYYAQATNADAFVWADYSTNSYFSSTTTNQYNIRSAGGVRIATTSSGTVGVQLAAGATSWSSLSDRNSKKNFRPVDPVAVLDKLAAIPVEQWNYTWEPDSAVPNLGPMAQDFKAAFYPGRDDKGISTLEFDGVELAAIQALNQKLEAQRAENAELKRELAELKRLVHQLSLKLTGGAQ